MLPESIRSETSKDDLLYRISKLISSPSATIHDTNPEIARRVEKKRRARPYISFLQARISVLQQTDISTTTNSIIIDIENHISEHKDMLSALDQRQFEQDRESLSTTPRSGYFHLKYPVALRRLMGFD